jgi:hypothetical protein
LLPQGSPIGTPGWGGGLALVQTLLWVGVIGIGILILWQFRKRLVPGSVLARVAQTWRLGPWPVNPARVATRTELIQAFEYLSLLLLGVAARSWNHVDIAMALGAQARGPWAEKQRAAERLAALYAEARYAPENEPLTGLQLAEARRNLCYLAGVAAA